MHTMSDDDRKRRAEHRQRTMTMRRTRLGEEDDSVRLKGAEAISLVTKLTRMSFGYRQSDAASYTRRDIPVRFVPRAGE
jgi:hypothetical protein